LLADTKGSLHPYLLRISLMKNRIDQTIEMLSIGAGFVSLLVVVVFLLT